MKENEGLFSQSLRSRTAQKSNDKTQTVIHEDREFTEEAFSGTPEAEVLLELVKKGSSWNIIIPEILLGCIWWSVVQSFPPILLHSSVVEKKPYGFELLAVCYLSPLLAKRYPAMEKFMTSSSGLLISRIGLSAALLGYNATGTLSRLSLSFIGNMFVPLILSRLWLANDPLDRSRKIHLHLLGYLLLLVLRVFWLTLDPLRFSDTMNDLAIVTCVASSIYLYWTDEPCPSVEVGDHNYKESQSNRERHTVRSFAVAMSLGSLLFLTNWLFGELSVIGILTRSQSSAVPMSFLEGIVTMMALATGLTVLSDKENLISHPVWYAVGLGSGLIFSYHLFVGGCVLALFSTSLWPSLLELASCHPSTLILTVSLVTYFTLTSMSALVTGHDSIPGVSLLFDESPVVLMILSVAIVVLGVQKCWLFNNNPLVRGRPLRRRSRSRSSQISFFGSAWRRLSTITEENLGEEDSDNDDAFEDEAITTMNLIYDLAIVKGREGERFLSVIQKVTFLLFLATVFGHVMQASTVTAPPIKDDHQQVTVVMWSANFGYTTTGSYDLQRTAALLNATRADIIGVFDCDTFYPFFGSYNMMGWLMKKLNMFIYSTNIRDTGVGVISHYHINNSSHQLLHTGEGKYAVVAVTINISNYLVDCVFVKPRHHRAHMINCSQLDLQKLSETINISHHSRTILFHFTFCNYSSFLSGGWKHISSHTEGMSTHILYNNLTRLSYMNTGELVMAQFTIPEHHSNHKVVTDTNKYNGLHWEKFLDTFYKDTQHGILRYFT